MKNYRVRIYEQGAPSVLRYEALSSPLETPLFGEVKLRHEAIGLNFVDTMFRDGTFPVTLPFDMGVEAAGVIEEIGPEVKGFKVGDRVAYFFSPGAYSDVRLMDSTKLIKLPDDISTRRAASILAKGLTAWMAIKRAVVIKPGDVVYVNGVSGGVGKLIAQWAVELGATVISGVGSIESASIATANGIKNVVISSGVDFETQVNAVTKGGKVDVVYELVGKATFKNSLRILKNGGSLVHIGSASGEPTLDQTELSNRQINYIRPSTPQFINSQKSMVDASSDLFQAIRSGFFGELQTKQYQLSDVVQAHKDIAERRNHELAVLLP